MAHLYSDQVAGWTTGVRLPSGVLKGLFRFETVSETIQPPIHWILGALSPGVKGPEREADNSPPVVLTLRIRGAIPPFPHTCSWRGT